MNTQSGTRLLYWQITRCYGSHFTSASKDISNRDLLLIVWIGGYSKIWDLLQVAEFSD